MLAHVWGEESIRAKDLDHPWHMMGAPLIIGAPDSIRRALVRLKPGRKETALA